MPKCEHSTGQLHGWLLAVLVAVVLTLAESVSAAGLTWDSNRLVGGAQGGSGLWDTATSNWLNGVVNQRFSTGSNVTFGGTAGVVSNIANITAGSLTLTTAGHQFAVANSRTLTINGGIQGAFDFTKQGAGTILAAGLGNFSATASINGGTLTLGSARALGTGTIRFTGLGGTLNLQNDGATNYIHNLLVEATAQIVAARLSGAGPTGQRLSVGNVSVLSGVPLAVSGNNGYTVGVGDLTLNGLASLSLSGANGIFVTGNYSDSASAQIFLAGNNAANRDAQGFQFANGRSSTINGQLNFQTTSGGNTLGASGAGTIVNLAGGILADSSTAQTYFDVYNGGQIVVGDTAIIDTANSNRPFRIIGDGTGAVIFSPGFVSNPTASTGLSSVRVGNARWVTQSSGNIGMPSIIFDIADGAIWETRLQAQTFAGAVNINQSVTLQTETKLTLTGTLTSDNANRVLTKTGPDTLALAGAAANSFSGTLNINGGIVSAEKNSALGSVAAIVVNSGAGLALAGSSALNTRIANGAGLTLNGGKLIANGTVTETLGPLSLGAGTSRIELGASGSVQLTFGNSTAAPWLGGLDIVGYDFGQDQLLFPNGLSVSQLSKISLLDFNGPGSRVGVVLQGNSVVPVPEPSTIAFLAFGFAFGFGCRHRACTRK